MKFCASLNFLFAHLPPEERPAAAAAAGFDGVEIQDFSIAEPSALAKAAQAAGVKVVLLNAPLGDLFAGGPGLSGAPHRETAFDEALAATLNAARALKPLYVNVGAFRMDAAAGADWTATYERNIRKASRVLKEVGATPLLEPMNSLDIPGVTPGDFAFAAQLVRERFRGAVGLQFDTYHAARRGEAIAETVEAYADLIMHVQVSDYPGRGEPGSGDLDFSSFFARLRSLGYDGYVGAEYKPTGATADSLSWLALAAGR